MGPTVYRASAGYLLRHPWQLGLALLGVTIGVAVIVAVDLANSSARKAFILSMDTLTGEATHQVVGGPSGIDESVYVRLRTEHGFERIAPVVEGDVSVEGSAFQLLGIDPFAEQDIRAFTGGVSATSGDDGDATEFFADMLLRPGAAVLSAEGADRLGIEAGDAFEVRAGGSIHEAFLVGTYSPGDVRGLDTLMTVDIATAQEWTGSAGRLSRIDVRLPDGDEPARERFAAVLPGETALLSAAGRTRSTAEMSAAFMTNLTAMSLLALLVGLFLIYNSISFSVLQRRQLFGVLRALGVTRRQVFGLALAEAAALGFVAALAGVGLGVWLGEGLLGLVARSINDFYFRVTVTDVAVDGFSIAKGLVAGTGAALVGALVPAFEAAGHHPRLSLVRSTLEQRTTNLLPAVTLTGCGVMLVSALVIAVSGRSLIAGLTAVFMLILGFALCVPIVVKRLTGMLAPVAGRVGGVLSRLAVAGIGASLSRTGVAIVALAVAVSATMGVSIMVDSFRGSVSDWLGQTLQADVYAGVSRGSMDPALIRDIRQLPGVSAVSTSRRSVIEDERGRSRIQALEMVPGGEAAVELLDAQAPDVWSVFETDDAVLVSEPYAYRNRTGPGDSLRLRTSTGERPFRVLATYQSYDINASAILMSRDTYDRHFNDPGIDSVGLYLEDGVDPARISDAVLAIASGRQEIVVNSNARIREISLQIFDRTFVITDVLYWLALGVAMVGILGAMFALQLEKARDLAVLRAVGMTPAQLGGMIVMQTGVIGLLAGIAAIPLGVGMAWVLIDVINRRAFGWQIDMDIAPEILLSSALYAVVAAFAAGIYPAIRAARSVPALAMREE